MYVRTACQIDELFNPDPGYVLSDPRLSPGIPPKLDTLAGFAPA